MKTMTVKLASAMALTVGSAFATLPEVTSVTMTQQSKSSVKIDYTLAAGPAVITLDIQTNCTASGQERWVSVGGEHIRTFRGNSEVWMKVSGDATHTITWNPSVDMPNVTIPDGGLRAVVTAWPLDNTPDYLVVPVDGTAGAGAERYYPAVEFLPGGLLDNADYRTSKLVMRKILAKDVPWTMGTVTEASRKAEYEMQHEVTLTNNYYVGVFEVTQGQWANVMPYNDSRFAYEPVRAYRPVENVSFNEIRCADTTEATSVRHTAVAANLWPNPPHEKSFLGKLRAKTGLDFDLPSEAEWEFACRAGHGEGYWGNGAEYTDTAKCPNVPGRVRYNGGYAPDYDGADPIVDGAKNTKCTAEYGTAIVGSYPPNSWGVYDMHGNVLECCLDWFEEDITRLGGRVNVDPDAPDRALSGTVCEGPVFRGQCYTSATCQTRSGYRGSRKANTHDSKAGLRVVCRAGLE